MTEIKTLDSTKKAAIIAALQNTKTANEAATALGISRATLYRLMSKYGISRGGLDVNAH